MKQPITIDFETEAIRSRPDYPPKPVGVAIKYPGKHSKYLAWGHPHGNNCAKRQAEDELWNIWRSDYELLFHHAKSDLDVAEVHLGLKLPPWHRIHDTMLILFLLDPHAESLSLKPSAQKYLGMPPEEQDAVADWLREHKIIGHNEAPGPYISKAPASVVGPYARGDVERTLKLYLLLHPKLDAKMKVAYDRERRVLPIFLQNERQGLRLDVDRLEQDLEIYEAASLKCENWLRKKLKVDSLNFDNAVEVGNALFKTKIVTNWTWTKGGKNRPPQRSVAKDNLGPERFNDPMVASKLGYRTRLHTVLANSMRPWLAQASSGGRIYTEINQVRHHERGKDSRGARTGRVAASRFMNVTKNFLNKGDGYLPPLDLPSLPLVRNYVLPDKGKKWNHRDVRQEEFRVTAHYEGGRLAQRYLTDPLFDVHDSVRDYIRTLGDAELARVDRVIIKNFNHGVLYGEGAETLARKSRLSLPLAHKLKEMIWQALPDVKILNDELKRMGRSGEPIRTWGGRLYYCEPPSYSERFGRDMTWEYKLLDYLAQGSSADLGKEAIIRYHDVKDDDARMLIFIHDEINVEAPPKLVDKEDKKLKECIETLEFDVPMLTDRKLGGVNVPWGSIKKVEG